MVALRDSKVRLVSELRAQARQLREVQRRLAAHLRRPPPVPPPVLPEEAPGQRLQCDRATLERYRALREQRYRSRTTLIRVHCTCFISFGFTV